MRYKLSVHHLVLARSAVRELVHSLARTILNKELSQTFNYFVGFQAHLGFVACNQVEQHLLEVGMRYETSKHVDVTFTH